MRRSIVIAFVLCLSLAHARVRFFFTSNGDDLVGEIIASMRHAEQRAQADRPASIDISMFQFSHDELAEELARLAAENPKLRIRIILDLSEIAGSGRGAGPWLEAIKNHEWNDAAINRLGRSSAKVEARAAYRDELRAAYGEVDFSNLEIKYKWYPEAYIWDSEQRRPRLEHHLSLLLHHKACIVNGQELIAGSFNWSPQAAKSNYEHIMIFSGSQERPVVDAWQQEFDAMWSNDEDFKDAPEARRLRKALLRQLAEDN